MYIDDTFNHTGVNPWGSDATNMRQPERAIVSGIGLVLVWYQAITWKNTDLFSAGPLGIKFIEIWMQRLWKCRLQNQTSMFRPQIPQCVKMNRGLCCVGSASEIQSLGQHSLSGPGHCPASRTTLVATRFRVAVICPIIQVPHCIRVFFYFVWFVFINHIFQFHNELCTYCNILDIYLS